MVRILSATYRELAYVIILAALFLALCCLIIFVASSGRRHKVVPVELVEGFENHLNEKRYQEAYELAKNDESMLGQVLSAGLAKLSAGHGEAVEAMRTVATEEHTKLRDRVSYVAWLAKICFLIGIMGFLHGIISVLHVIADRAGEFAKGEIAKSLASTLVPLFLATAIALVAYTVHDPLEKRVNRFLLEVNQISESLMSRFENLGASGSSANSRTSALGAKSSLCPMSSRSQIHPLSFEPFHTTGENLA